MKPILFKNPAAIIAENEILIHRLFENIESVSGGFSNVW